MKSLIAFAVSSLPSTRMGGSGRYAGLSGHGVVSAAAQLRVQRQQLVAATALQLWQGDMMLLQADMLQHLQTRTPRGFLSQAAAACRTIYSAVQLC